LNQQDWRIKMILMNLTKMQGHGTYSATCRVDVELETLLPSLIFPNQFDSRCGWNEKEKVKNTVFVDGMQFLEEPGNFWSKSPKWQKWSPHGSLWSSLSFSSVS
jgi:hypothetical protein